MSSFINEKIHVGIEYGPVRLYSLAEKYCILTLSPSPTFAEAVNDTRYRGLGSHSICSSLNFSGLCPTA